MAKEFGFWREQGSRYDRFPSITNFIGHDGGLSEGVLAQLESAPVIASTSGLAFPCVLCGKVIASSVSVRGDSEWTWLDTLPHYIRVHALRLPAELIEHLKGYG
jgi:hypothetical protein